MIYLDYNATAPLREPAFAAMTEVLRAPGNPSSVHRDGRQARRRVEEAREIIASALNADAAGVIFTSGGTEANNLALTAFPGRRILASAVEHPSILKGKVDTVLPVDRHGVIDLAALDEALSADKSPALLALMLANNETGVIQPVAEAAALAHRYGAWVHADAIQAFGKIPVDLAALGLDSLSLSAHKIGGPQGIGALVLADSEVDLQPLLVGGGQERRNRAGTENVAAIVGFGAAVADLGDLAEEGARLAALRDRFERAALDALPGITIFGRKVGRLPNTSCLALPGVPAQTVLMALDLAGFAISAGSACSSGKLSPSPVLLAMGEQVLATAAIRVSLGWATQGTDLESFIGQFVSISERLIREHKAA
jgi:cysteine desulfurase